MNAGRLGCLMDSPEVRVSLAGEEVRVDDVLDKTLGKAIPYGVYDVAHNEGWGSVGIDHHTARFTTEALRRWDRRAIRM